MSSRYTSAFDELLAKNRRELDALYQGAGPSPPRRASNAPASAEPAAASTARPPDTAPHDAGLSAPSEAAATAAPPPAGSPAERLLDERCGDGWRFEITSRRRERDEVIVVGTLRLPGSGGVRTQFGTARITSGGGSTGGSAGGVAFSFGRGGGESPLATEEAAFERAREDALASCAALVW